MHFEIRKSKNRLEVSFNEPFPLNVGAMDFYHVSLSHIKKIVGYIHVYTP